MTARLDRRLLTSGMGVTVAQLVTLWADHTPARLPVPVICPGCGHPYSEKAPLCPTAAVVRPLLRRRRHEIPGAIDALTTNQLADLTGNRLSTALPAEVTR
ncbi:MULTISPECIES: hypothetical protein [Micromonospora]|uniref:Uncharacterized protein n=1 Tax=Micromonospora maris TaxID=1003110 RepID=A0A9X0I475_9ACTN|nr:hypothetical protein [Micromonospora maris]AEB47414.1 hypothetical protein VAB18032_01650 [Micromonospora maris AB-18-032]KUJ46491.1 hypothetical protein ADL17_26650 [Micromonospora maris]